MEYKKPYKTFQEQVELWISRGLIISDLAIAEKTFARLNYYRLSAYALPFQKILPIFEIFAPIIAGFGTGNLQFGLNFQINYLFGEKQEITGSSLSLSSPNSCFVKFIWIKTSLNL